jgi:hypothetical protein
LSDEASKLEAAIRASVKPPLSKVERELLATPDVDLIKGAKVDSFDTQKFLARVNQGEQWQQLLQMHLYYDHVVTQTLAEAFPNPDAANLRRMGFSQKLQLVSAMQLYPQWLIPPIEFVNNLRNKIAHDLEFEITDKEIKDFTNCVPKVLRSILQKDTQSPDSLSFDKLLCIVLLQMDNIRQNHVCERILMSKQAIHARVVVERIPNVTYRK